MLRLIYYTEHRFRLQARNSNYMKNTSTNPTTMRADAQRNFDKLLVAAEAAFAEEGANASLKDIAARAHVGIGTLYRRFPDRASLLEAVYGKHIEELCAQAEALLTAEPAVALRTWLGDIITLVAAYRGLDDLLAQALSKKHSYLPTYHAALRTAGEKLLFRAQKSDAIRKDVTIDDILTLTSALATRIQKTAALKTEIPKLVSLVIDGLHSI